MDGIRVRTATLQDVPALEAMIANSERALGAGHYTGAQIEAGLGTVFGVDPAMVSDETYYVAEVDGVFAACGGWSFRATPYGTGRSPEKNDRPLDPAREPAKIRAFFTDPAFARRGLASRILAECERAARERGFTRAELTATLTGVALYAARGYAEQGRVDVPLADGGTLIAVRMTKTLR